MSHRRAGHSDQGVPPCSTLCSEFHLCLHRCRCAQFKKPIPKTAPPPAPLAAPPVRWQLRGLRRRLAYQPLSWTRAARSSCQSTLRSQRCRRARLHRASAAHMDMHILMRQVPARPPRSSPPSDRKVIDDSGCCRRSAVGSLRCAWAVAQISRKASSRQRPRGCHPFRRVAWRSRTEQTWRRSPPHADRCFSRAEPPQRPEPTCNSRATPSVAWPCRCTRDGGFL